MIKVITDSASDIVENKRENLVILPITITFGGPDWHFRCPPHVLHYCILLPQYWRSARFPTVGKARGSRQGNNLLAEQIRLTGGIDFGKPFFLGYTGLSDAMLRLQ